MRVCVHVLLCLVIWFYVLFIICLFDKEATHLSLRVPDQQHVSSPQMPPGVGVGCGG